MSTEETKIASRSVVDHNGCRIVTIPSEIADDLGIEKGDTVMWRHDVDTGNAVMAPDLDGLVGYEWDIQME